MSKKSKQKKLQKEIVEAESRRQRQEHLLSAKEISTGIDKIIRIASVIITLCIGIYFLASSYAQNGYWGFPLDDPWIHLNFAKNLVEYGSFSYFKNEIVTSGSTSPIYTAIIALLFFISSNEFIISYIIGIIFSMISVFFVFRLFSDHFKSYKLLGAAAVLFFAVQPKLNLISVSGMETTMFIALLVMVFYFYKIKNFVWLGISLGLTIWCRPDGFVVWVVVIIDYFIKTRYNKSVNPQDDDANFSIRELILSFIIADILLFIYFGFNYILSGEILPNTYSAKTEYYGNNQRSYFLTEEVLKYFSSKEFLIIVIPFLTGFAAAVFDFIRRKRNEFIIYFLFITGFILIYYLMLPFAHRFGRYLMPVIPFYILTSFYGLKIIFDFLLNKKTAVGIINFIFIAFTAAGIILSAVEINANQVEYAALCKYHNDRHVAAGKWLKENTLPEDVVATHDIGAIAYYSERKIIDIAGLVTPELISHISEKNYSAFVNNYLSQHKIDYLVTLRNWFEAANDNPVFIPVNEFEYLEIFKYKPGKTYIMAKEATIINMQAIQYLQQNDFINAEGLIRRSISVDPRSSKTLFIAGIIAENKKDYANAESYYKKAVEIFPDYIDANFALARVEFNSGKFNQALENLHKCLEINPDYKPARDLMTAVKGRISGEIAE